MRRFTPWGEFARVDAKRRPDMGEGIQFTPEQWDQVHKVADKIQREDRCVRKVAMRTACNWLRRKLHTEAVAERQQRDKAARDEKYGTLADILGPCPFRGGSLASRKDDE